ncbi:hypothetical protein AB4Z48_17815 [Cupriavidus sp. 2TAF22]|uniref:hypothetical protein n=1 Tax=unclassified Cupriavidus TaxID=2640874 RepID=UPI003F910868
MTTFLFPDEEESHAYWSTREFKAWAVTLTTGPEKKPTARHVMYVRARTAESAKSCALENNFAVKGRIRAHARLATWRELGCMRAVA